MENSHFPCKFCGKREVYRIDYARPVQAGQHLYTYRCMACGDRRPKHRFDLVEYEFEYDGIYNIINPVTKEIDGYITRQGNVTVLAHDEVQAVGFAVELLDVMFHEVSVDFCQPTK